MRPHLLIVDDDDDFCGIASRLLADRGYRVIGQAGTLAEARLAIEELNPDAVLLDVNLPDGDGVSLAEELATSRPGLRVLLTSTDATPGGTRFVAKTDLVATDLERYLG
jgi:response regulator of citrate/malate metabolism